jgi:hypothetical protein
MEQVLLHDEAFVVHDDPLIQVHGEVYEAGLGGVGLIAATNQRLLYRGSNPDKPLVSIAWPAIARIRTHRSLRGDHFLEVVNQNARRWRWGMHREWSEWFCVLGLVATRSPTGRIGVERAGSLGRAPNAETEQRQYRATHRVSEVALAAFSRPDATAPPIAYLDPRLELQVLERWGDWARVVCSNGWQGWVDGRPLIEADQQRLATSEQAVHGEGDRLEVSASEDRLDGGPFVVGPKVAAVSRLAGLPLERDAEMMDGQLLVPGEAAQAAALGMSVRELNQLVNEATQERAADAERYEPLDGLLSELDLDERWVQHDGGTCSFRWWGGPLAQEVRVAPGIERNGREFWPLMVSTELLHAVDPNHPFIQQLGRLNSFASTSRLVFDPETRRILSVFSWLVPRESRRDDDLATVRAGLVLQGYDALQRLPTFSKVEGLVPAVSGHPGRHVRDEPDRLFGWVRGPLAEAGQQPSRFRGAELAALPESPPPEFLMVNGDGAAITANLAFGQTHDDSLVSFMHSTSLSQLNADFLHPALGSGLFVLLQLPTVPLQEPASVVVNMLNLAETREHLDYSGVGAWCEDASTPGDIAHVTFWPSGFSRPGLISQIAIDLGRRSAWAAAHLSPRPAP